MDKALCQAVPERFWVIDSPLGERSGPHPSDCAWQLDAALVRFFKRFSNSSADFSTKLLYEL